MWLLLYGVIALVAVGGVLAVAANLLFWVAGAIGEASRLTRQRIGDAACQARRDAWLRQHPINLSVPGFAPDLIVEWRESLQAYRRDLLKEWDFDGDEEPPTELDYFAASAADRLSVWLAESAVAFEAGASPSVFKYTATEWIAVAQAAAGRLLVRAEWCRDDPAAYWDRVLESRSMQGLAEWLAANIDRFPEPVQVKAQTPGAVARAKRTQLQSGDSC